ncbi:Magnesium transporter NIPA [Saccharopolyspora antimicrobica]|uniref:Magnesium transporter NIPA n=1 Tax=Saccharopolyspora antimicrobica TaxID=455193 RepID=A0A1I4RLQ9_9PSEU|nr:DMT family transporter [Saccharopolyspora antimicrobica]RKT87960.1 magnesium transporter NIPA [Saccharopolyspora antimicrobica]SFM53161.1 Magnesium transporter NIPA [Saccharopolyspora antimicrobica]
MSSNSTVLVIAVPAAVVGAASFGLASAIQHRVTKQVPKVRTFSPRMLFDLVRKPIWVLSILTVIIGLSLQVVALAFGPLVLVQPLLVTSVLFGAAFAAWMAHRRMDLVLALGGLACVGGLSAFLVLARPSGQSSEFTGASILPLALALGLLVVVSLAAAQLIPGEAGVIGMAVATGVLYGVTAGLIKVVAGQFRTGGPAEPFQHWTLYAVCVIGPMGFLLSQQTFQRGRLMSPALAVITTVDPLVAAAIGVSWLGERIESSPAILAGEVIAGVVIVVGIVILTRRGEQLRRALERADGGSDPTWG